MKSLLLFLALILLIPFVATPRTIKSVVHKPSGIQIVDNRGRRSSIIAIGKDCQLMGNNDAFCIVRRGEEYQFYNPSGQRYLRVDTARIGKIFAITGDTFSAGNDSVRTTYNADATPLSTRLIALSDTILSDTVATPHQNLE